MAVGTAQSDASRKSIGPPHRWRDAWPRNTMPVIREAIVESVLTIRIDAATQRKLDRLARERRTSRSDIVRQALSQLTSATPANGDTSVYARVADLVGSFSSGRGDLSTDTGRRLAALVKAKRKR
jgi:predicted transcriptional regulator